MNVRNKILRFLLLVVAVTYERSLRTPSDNYQCTIHGYLSRCVIVVVSSGMSSRLGLKVPAEVMPCASSHKCL